MNFSASWLHCP